MNLDQEQAEKLLNRNHEERKIFKQKVTKWKKEKMKKKRCFKWSLFRRSTRLNVRRKLLSELKFEFVRLRLLGGSGEVEKIKKSKIKQKLTIARSPY